MRNTAIIVIVVVLVAVGIGALVAGSGGGSSSKGSSAASSGLPGLLTGPPPWTNNTEQLGARLNQIHLPQLSAEGTVLHIHQHLDLLIDGNPITVPAGIGIPTPETFISPLHTHDETGIIHLESPTNQDFFLGQFFDVWGLRLSSICIGGYCEDNKHKLKIFVNGVQRSGDPRQITLAAHQEIVIDYGTAGELAKPVPSSYQFAAGL
jgi:hypothetical protein